MMIQTINPSSGDILNEYKAFTDKEIEQCVERSHRAFQDWKTTGFGHRAGLMKKAAALLRERKQILAELMAVEMGKPISQGIAEAEKCAWVCDYYADNAEAFLDDIEIKTEMKKSYASFQPLGPVLAIMPWNFPFWQVFRFAAPALMAGNTGLLKHSRNTTGCSIEIENIFKRAGFPDGVFQSLIIGSEPVAGIIQHPLVAAVTLTGSTPVGKSVARTAGSSIKKSVLELGGSDPYIILRDADIARTAATCATARLINSGQSCIAAKRFIVEKVVLDEFIHEFTREMKSFVMGDPLKPETQVGPQARGDLRDDLHRQVTESISAGAELLLGGEIGGEPGYFYPPTILANVKEGMAAYHEETFGPVAAIISAEDESDAVRIANVTEFGLGAAVFTADLEKGERIARNELQAGACFVNAFVRSDPRLPFGGIKNSGYGRELSLFGIREFVNIKSVCVD